MFNLHVDLEFSGETEHRKTYHVDNFMMLFVFVPVVEAQKLEVCIHKQNYISTWFKS